MEQEQGAPSIQTLATQTGANGVLGLALYLIYLMCKKRRSVFRSRCCGHRFCECVSVSGGGGGGGDTGSDKADDVSPKASVQPTRSPPPSLPLAPLAADRPAAPYQPQSPCNNSRFITLAAIQAVLADELTHRSSAPSSRPATPSPALQQLWTTPIQERTATPHENV